MDTGEGKFRIAEIPEDLTALKKQYKNHGGTFRVGERIKLRGSLFRVKTITPTGMRLKLLKRAGIELELEKEEEEARNDQTT